jgi:Ca-activated chloride channel family protein
LLTDGLANVGITDHGQLSSMAASAAGRGVTTTTIGFGDGFDEELLSAMADSGGGRDHFAASPEEAPSIFAQEFDGLAAMVAQNLSVEVLPVGPAINVGILNEYPITSTGNGLQAALGDVYGGEVRKLVFEVHAPAMADLGEVKVAEVVIRWADIGVAEVKMHTRTIPVMVNVVSGADASGQPADSRVIDQVVILGAAKARKEARTLADQGDFDGARRILQDQTERLGSIAAASELFATATDDIEQLERFSHRLEMRTYDRIASKELWDQSRRRERSEEFRKRPDRP